MQGQVRGDVARQRSARLRAAFAGSATAYRARFLGRTLEVLWETVGRFSGCGWQVEGLAGNSLRVAATAPSPLWNVISPVLLTGLDEDGLTGTIQLNSCAG
jgi:tRNA A37 methylthiotransferase MiaB